MMEKELTPESYVQLYEWEQDDGVIYSGWKIKVPGAPALFTNDAGKKIFEEAVKKALQEEVEKFNEKGK